MVVSSSPPDVGGGLPSACVVVESVDSVVWVVSVADVHAAVIKATIKKTVTSLTCRINGSLPGESPTVQSDIASYRKKQV